MWRGRKEAPPWLDKKIRTATQPLPQRTAAIKDSACYVGFFVAGTLKVSPTARDSDQLTEYVLWWVRHMINAEPLHRAAARRVTMHYGAMSPDPDIPDLEAVLVGGHMLAPVPDPPRQPMSLFSRDVLVVNFDQHRLERAPGLIWDGTCWSALDRSIVMTWRVT